MNALLAPLQLTALQLAIAMFVVVGAAVVRGYSGFGFAMFAVTGLSLLRPPAEIVPMVLVLEIIASLQLLPSVWGDVDWRSLRWLLIGMVLSTPVGVWVLTAAPAAATRTLVSVLVLLASVALWQGFSLRQVPGPRATFATGAVSGLLNGSAGIGGPPAILFYFSSPAGAVVSRASLITYFLGTDIVAAVFAAAYGLLTAEALLRALALLVPLALGVAIGNRRFIQSNPESFRRIVLVLLMLLAIAGLIRAGLG
jgi:uncharacterized membrane protein YfcA